jgi:O-antigen ligase
MKEIFVINDSLGNKISYWLMALFMASLPFDRLYSELILIGLLAHTLIQMKWRAIPKADKNTWLPVSLYLLAVLSSLYSHFRGLAVNDLEKKLALLLFPLIFLLNPLDIYKYRINLLKIFCIVCTLCIIYLFWNAFRTCRYFHLSLTSIYSNIFLNQNFSAPINMHATYLSMYVCLSIASAIYIIKNEQNKNLRTLYIGGLLVLLAGLFQLSSRAVFLAMLLIVNFCIPFLLLKKQAGQKFFLVSVMLTFLLIVAIFSVSSYKQRYMVDLKEDLTRADRNFEILEPRIVRWHSALTLIKKSPVFGYGNGDEIPLLRERYFEERLYNSYLYELNAHNQYLSYLLRSGIIGLGLYINVLCFGFSTAFRNRDFIFFSFMGILALVSFSENILDVNKGIFFYAFFFSFFLSSARRTPQLPDP